MLRILPALAGLLLTGIFSAQAVDEELPQVLFLGDPVHRTTVTAAAKELKGRVQITVSPVQTHDSGSALALIDELIGDKKWDLIYFNFGIGDLFYKDPRTKEIRAMSKYAGGVPVSTPEQYAVNLDQLARRLADSGARLLWGSTTPLVTIDFFPSYKENLFEANSELEYNEIAAAVMKRQGIPVVDLHAYIMEQFEEDEKHPGYSKYNAAMEKKGHPLHAPLVRAILTELEMAASR